MLNAIASAGRRALPNQWDLVAFAAILAVLTAIAKSYHGISAPLPAPNELPVSLDYWELPYYAFRTTLRMFAALAASLVFTFTYAALAAKSRRAEMVPIPAVDVLQSVPTWAFYPSPVTFFSASSPAIPWARNSQRFSRSSPVRPGTWPFPSTSRCAPYPAISMRWRADFA